VSAVALDPSFAKGWTAAGLAGSLPVISADLAETISRINRERVAFTEAADRAVASRRHAIETGAGKPSAPPTGDLADFGIATMDALRSATRELREIGDRLITEDLAPAWLAIREEAASLIPLTKGLTGDADALRPTTSTAAREAWVRLSDLDAQREALEALLRTIISDGVVPTVPREHVDGWPWRRYARPDRVPPWPTGVRVVVNASHRPDAAVVLRSIVVDEHDQQPGFYTSTEIVKNRAAAEREAIKRAKAEQAPQPSAYSTGGTTFVGRRKGN
jgi:hypothetical protein